MPLILIKDTSITGLNIILTNNDKYTHYDKINIYIHIYEIILNKKENYFIWYMWWFTNYEVH